MAILDPVAADRVEFAFGNNDLGWHTASVIELTTLDAKIEADRFVRSGQLVQFGIRNQKDGQVLRYSGVTHWCRKVKDTYQVGVFFDAPIDEGIVLAKHGERRQNLRYEVLLPLYVNSVTEGVCLQAIATDYSLNGCAFTSTRLFEAGETVRLDLSDSWSSRVERHLEGVVRWSEPFQKNLFLTGCESDRAVAVALSDKASLVACHEERRRAFLQDD